MSEDNGYPAAPEGSIRLNKFLASCGYESRRAADRLIAEGRVEVNGKAVDTPGLRVMPTDFVRVDGRHATPKEEVVILLNKPRGYVCSREPQGAIGTVYDLLPAKYRYANYVGRLDADSEGLLLFTNNGSISQSIAHPKGGIEKEYWVTLDQAFDSSVLLQLLKGVRIPEGQAKAKYVSRLSARRACVVLEQGLKRQVRQMFACLGLRVKKLVRVRIGSMWGGDLEPGHCELLSPERIAEATTNPRRRKGLMGAKQVFKPRRVSISPDKEEEEEAGYIFNPADFETEEEALGISTKFTDGEAFEPEREDSRRPFGRAPRKRREWDDAPPRERRSFGDRERNPFGERRSFGDRERKPFGERRSFGDRERKPFGERRSFGDRERKPFGERRSFGDRERKPFGERRSFGDRERKPFGERRSFGDRERKSSFGERRSFGDRERKPFGERRSFGDRKTFGGPRSFGKRRGE
ncbi:MAG: pseudouridine synthase [Akkermansia sp.]|nr:pseudouridine synthase [Akkermansia sp.]